MQVQYAQVDQEQLAVDINAVKETIGKPTTEDFKHLKKVERWGRCLAIMGYLTAWIFPLNLLSALLISAGNVCRWANVAHPVMHGAYDKVPGVPERYTRKKFAKGWRRIVDWLDWIEPKSWDYEHNTKHHYNLGEKSDPDNVEINLRWLRESNIPMWMRYVIVISFACIWKFAYYSPQTLKIQANHEREKRGEAQHKSFMRLSAWSPFCTDGFRLWTRCYLPYIGFRFVFMPSLFLPLGVDAALNVLMASLLAEVFTNLHSFFIIVPNHSAEDIYRFEEPGKGRGEFYLRQIIGTVNYKTGSDRIDFLHGWLNYQVEHHLFPSLPLNHYQEMQPIVKEICKKHNLPYRQEGVFKRAWMTIELMVGKSSQLVIRHA